MVSSLKRIIKKSIPTSFIVRRINSIWARNDLNNWPQSTSREKQGIERYEYSLFSQNGEDGILRYLFSTIGFRSKHFVEFGFGVTENNSLRLMLKEGFSGSFIDGSKINVDYFNKAAKSFGINKVQAFARFLDLENLETTLIETGTPREIDLLSIDVDGNDYWFWEKIRCLSPRVLVIEYNASLGPELSLCTPYDPLFARHEKHSSGFYCGASISALAKLGRKKGYSLVGCDSRGVNAFFVKDDCLTSQIEVFPPQLAFRPHKDRLDRGFSLEEQYRMIMHMPFVNII